MPTLDAAEYTELVKAAYEYAEFSQQSTEAWQSLDQAKTRMEVARNHALTARGRVTALLSRSEIEAPYTIAIGGDRLLTVYESEDGFSRSFVITQVPKPQ